MIKDIISAILTLGVLYLIVSLVIHKIANWICKGDNNVY